MRGPWNEGEMPDMGKQWDYIEDPVAYIKETKGLTVEHKGMENELKETEELDKKMSRAKSEEVKSTEREGVTQWSTYAHA